MRETLLVFLLVVPFVVFAQNVGVGTNNPLQKLDVAGNLRLDDNMMVEGSSAYRIYRNLATFNNSTSAAPGAFAITTNQPWNSACMFRVELEGYFYDATAPFEITVGGYMYVNNDFHNYGYVNVSNKKLQVRLARNNSTNTVAIILGDEAASYSYPKISVRSFMQGHSGINETYADGWTISQVTTLSNFSFIVTVPDVTQAAPSPGSGNYIQNQNVSAQAADYWISGMGRAAQYQLTNSNTILQQGSGNALRVTTNSGYVEIGPQNTSWMHFSTDRPRYYFNKGITVDEGLIGSYDEDLSLQTQGTTRVTVKNSSGNVGIATASPSTLLHVVGGHGTTQARLTLPSGSNGLGTGEINMQLWVSEPGITWDAGGIGMNVTNDNGSPGGFGRINTGIGQSYIRFFPNGGAMQFTTTNNSGTQSNTMYMTGGNVGIGTTAPADKLDVVGNVRLSNGGELRLVTASGNLRGFIQAAESGAGPGSGLIIATSGGESIAFKDNGLSGDMNMTITGAGSVGIGTTSPGERLHVTSNVRADGIVYWGNGLVRTESRDNAGLRGDAGARSGFFETSIASSGNNWPSGASSWWHLIDVRHSNNSNNYALQLAGSFFDQNLYFRKTNDNAAQPWSKVVTGNQGASVYSATSEIALASNNTGSFSYTPAGSGWTTGTWQSVSGFNVTRDITSGSTVHVTVNARVEGDNYNSYVPSCAYFRVTRGGTEIAQTAVMLTTASYVPSSFWYYISNNLSLNVIDTGVSGNQTYSLEYWLPNEHSNTELVRLGERSMNVIELR